MASLKKREIDEIVANELPGYVVVDYRPATSIDTTTARQAGVETDAADVDYLRKKFFGQGVADAARPAERAEPESSDNVIVRIQRAADARARGPGAAAPKVVVISGKDRRIIGEQG